VSGILVAHHQVHRRRVTTRQRPGADRQHERRAEQRRRAATNAAHPNGNDRGIAISGVAE
jgi:hypothetical protein